jgi:dihydroxycyclohexadiene carboxylate dehydrogenase
MAGEAAWPGRFQGKAAVVTGAAQGIGRDVALRLAREGARVVLADRSELVHDAAREAGGALAVVADMELYAEALVGFRGGDPGGSVGGYLM